MKKIDYLLLIGILFVFLVGIFLIQYYFNFQKNQCINNPLVYGAKQIEDRFGTKFQGTGFLVVEQGQFPTLTFNSEGFKWRFLSLN